MSTHKFSTLPRSVSRRAKQFSEKDTLRKGEVLGWDGKSEFNSSIIDITIHPDNYKQFADFTFNLPDGKQVPFFKSILSVRWPHVFMMFLDKQAKEVQNWKNGRNPGDANVDLNITYKSLQAIFQYLCSGTLEFSKRTLREVAEILYYCVSFKLDGLRIICEHHLVSNLSMKTIYSILRVCNELQLITIQAHALDFALKNYTEFIGDKNVLHELGIEFFQETVTTLSAMSSTEAVPALQPIPLITKANEDFKKLYESMELSDGAFLVEKEKIFYHKCIIATASPIFLAICEKTGKSGEIQIPNISAEAFKSVLRFIYYGEKTVAAKFAIELLHKRFIREYDISDMGKLCTYHVYYGLSPDTVLLALALCYDQEFAKKPQFEEIRHNALMFFAIKFTEVDLTPIIKMDQNLVVDALLMIQQGAAGLESPKSARPLELKNIESPRRENRGNSAESLGNDSIKEALSARDLPHEGGIFRKTGSKLQIIDSNSKNEPKDKKRSQK